MLILLKNSWTTFEYLFANFTHIDFVSNCAYTAYKYLVSYCKLFFFNFLLYNFSLC